MNAVELVSSTKNQLEKFRLDGFNEFLEKVNSFCDMYELEVKKLDDEYVNPRWPRRKTNITNRHYYEYDCFNAVLDLKIQEFGNRFNEVTSKLLVCMSCLSPCDNISAFDIPNIPKLAEKYPYDFIEEEKRRFPVQLGNYFNFVKKDKKFANLDGLSSLVRLMVSTNIHVTFTLVYRLLKLVLVLSVATVERCFSAMKNVKTDLRNRIGDENLSNSCILLLDIVL
ncbi:uncharacterized protein LOC110886524 [Helianthus annuus]|uniref:uncharacterized protein LOC110886524 n=1 Tax=Helianthus annuus TaxID=4232 RepID=UPI000B8F1363|nr:uncharacterized protein LOC110886524 [Helianthus annuus]